MVRAPQKNARDTVRGKKDIASIKGCVNYGTTNARCQTGATIPQGLAAKTTNNAIALGKRNLDY
jgi:hypothetical protein